MDCLSADAVSLTLVNVNPVHGREVVVQAGAYGEHQITSVTVDGRKINCDSPFATLRLAPGGGCRIALATNRYANQPTFTFPWDR